MSEFQFAVRQRVIVPPAKCGAENVQGAVSSGHLKLGGEPNYIVQFQDVRKTNEAGVFEVAICTVTQSELIVAQPPKMIPAEDAVAAENAAFERGRSFEAANRAFAFAGASPKAKRKRKPAGKTKPKSKRNR